MSRSQNRFSNTLLNTALTLALTLPAGGALAATPVIPASWEVASEFSAAANPAGVWRYGSKPSVTGAFALMTNPVNAWSGNIKGWDTPAGVFQNVNPAPYVVPNPGGSVKVGAHGLHLHPGPKCQYAVVRFVAPTGGKYRIAGQFFGLDGNGVTTTTDAHIFLNATQLFIAQINVGGGTPNADFLINGIAVQAGDTLDFEVGCGVNGNYSYDATGLNAVISRL